MSQQCYSVSDVVARLEEEFGQRTTPNAVHKAAGRPRRANSRASLVAGLPGPIRASEGGALVFDADEVERWLAEHPRRVMQQAVLELERRVRAQPGPADLRAAVAAARAGGLSWAQIAEVLSRIDRPVSRQAVAERFS